MNLIAARYAARGGRRKKGVPTTYTDTPLSAGEKIKVVVVLLTATWVGVVVYQIAMR